MYCLPPLALEFTLDILYGATFRTTLITLFWTKFNFEQLLFEAFFMRCVFLAVLSHKLNVVFHISACSMWELSNPSDTSAEDVMLYGGFTELAELNYLCIYTLYYFASRKVKCTTEFQYVIPLTL